MPQHTHYEKGTWLGVCDICGLTFRSDALAQAWDGSWRCTGQAGKQCWEPRHPQDFVRGVMDDQSTPWSRPWVPGFTEVYTITNMVEASVGVQLPKGSQAFLPGCFPGVTYYYAAITGKLNGVEVEDFEIISVIQYVFNPTFLQVFFGARGQMGTTPKAWDIGAKFQPITDSLTV